MTHEASHVFPDASCGGTLRLVRSRFRLALVLVVLLLVRDPFFVQLGLLGLLADTSAIHIASHHHMLIQRIMESALPLAVSILTAHEKYRMVPRDVLTGWTEMQKEQRHRPDSRTVRKTFEKIELPFIGR